MLHQCRLPRPQVSLDPEYPIIGRKIGTVIPLLELGRFEEPITSRWVGRGDILPASIDISEAKGLQTGCYLSVLAVSCLRGA
jgi:hypothetical protein